MKLTVEKLNNLLSDSKYEFVKIDEGKYKYAFREKINDRMFARKNGKYYIMLVSRWRGFMYRELFVKYFFKTIEEASLYFSGLQCENYK